MPVLASSSYVTCEDVLNRMRVFADDSEVAGGDVLTDTAPYTFSMVNSGFERVQIELARVGVETMQKESWLIGLPIMPIQDPEARMVVDDSGCNILYPNGSGDIFSNTPQLPTDLILPLRLWERQTGTTGYLGRPMQQPNDGLLDIAQQTYLIDWQWSEDGLRFRGATQSQDVKILYEKALPKLIAPTDPVPIRGVLNAAAYWAVKPFIESRGGMIAPAIKQAAMEEIVLLQQIAARRRQRKQVRRKPYSGIGSRPYL